MASRNERRRKARQRATIAREAGHGVIDEATISPLLLKSAERIGTGRITIEKAAETRQPSPSAETWDPEKIIPPPIPPEQLWSVFETNAYHASAINAKVADAVGRGWTLTPEDPDEDGVDEDVQSVTRDLTDLLEDVCKRLTFRQLCEQATRELDAIGWADWEVLREKDGDITSDIVGILPVPSYSVRAVKGSDDVLCVKRGDKKVYFKRFGVEQSVNFETGDIGDNVPDDKRANELVHFQHYSPRSPWYGIPPWVSGMPAVAEFGAIREFNVSFFESGGQADRLIHVSAKDDDAAGELADKITKQIEDARGEAHVTIVTHADDSTTVNVTPLEPKTVAGTGSTRESNYRGGKQDLRDEILVAHQVPAYRVGLALTGQMGGNGADSMDDDYRIGVVEPLQEIVEAELRRTLFGEYGFAELLAGWEFSFESKTQDDTQDEHDRAMSSIDNAVMSPNDAREATGKDRIEDPAMERYYMGGKPISTDPALTDVTQLLTELRDALATAVKDPGKPDPAQTAEGEIDDPGTDDLETAPGNITASDTPTSRLAALFRRRPRGDGDSE